MAQHIITIIYDDNGGFLKKFEGCCAMAPDGSIWRLAVDNEGILTTELLEAGA